ncbi:hypothetical protein ACOMHN_000546 [Nucella lapillus]
MQGLYDQRLSFLPAAIAGLQLCVEGRTKREDKAIKQVLRNMTKLSKPLRLPPSSTKKQRSPVVVGIDFGLTSVSEVNEERGFVALEGMMSLMWQDSRLQFDLPKASKIIRTVKVNPKTIWTPDIELYHAMAPGLQTLTSQAQAVVSGSGDVFLARQVHLRAPCDVMGQLAVSNIVNCTLKLGSWTYNGFEVNLQVTSLNGADKLHDFQAAGRWIATSATAWAGADSYACCPESFPYARFSFHLRLRRPDDSLSG